MSTAIPLIKIALCRIPYAIYDLLFVTFDGLILRDIHTNGLFLKLWIFCAFCEGWIDGKPYFVLVHAFIWSFLFKLFVSLFHLFPVTCTHYVFWSNQCYRKYFGLFSFSLTNLLINCISLWTNSNSSVVHFRRKHNTAKHREK